MVSGLALSVTCGDSSPKVGALGSPRKLHLFTKSFPFKEGLSAQEEPQVQPETLSLCQRLSLWESWRVSA